MLFIAAYPALIQYIVLTSTCMYILIGLLTAYNLNWNMLPSYYSSYSNKRICVILIRHFILPLVTRIMVYFEVDHVYLVFTCLLTIHDRFYIWCWQESYSHTKVKHLILYRATYSLFFICPVEIKYMLYLVPCVLWGDIWPYAKHSAVPFWQWLFFDSSSS